MYGSSAAPAAPQGVKLFIGGVSWETTQDGMRYHFSKFGTVTDCILMMDKVTGQPRGFGFVTFADQSAVDRVLRETHLIDGRAVEVKLAVPKEAAPRGGGFGGGNFGRSGAGGGGTFGGGGGGGGGGGFGFGRREQDLNCKIFVGGLASTVEEGVFRSHFERYGAVRNAIVMMDRETGRSRGFGFITFMDADAVRKAMAETHEIDGKNVEVKLATARENNPRRQTQGGGGFHRGGMSQGSGGMDGPAPPGASHGIKRITRPAVVFGPGYGEYGGYVSTGTGTRYVSSSAPPATHPPAAPYHQ